MTQGFHEPPDILTGKARKHQENARKSKAKNISNAKIEPTINSTFEEDSLRFESAEDFVKAQGEPLYHGTPFDFEHFNNQITFFTRNKSFAENIASEQTDNIIEKMESDDYYPMIMECYFKDLKLWDINRKDDFELLKRELPNNVTFMNYYLGGSSTMFKEDYLNDLESSSENTWGLLRGTATDIIRNKGFDGWKETEKGKESIGIFDPSKVKTKAQLIRMWNSAHDIP